MTVPAHKHVDQTLLELQQVSVGRMLVCATVLYKQGMLHKVVTSTSRVRSKSEPLRVQRVEG